MNVGKNVTTSETYVIDGAFKKHKVLQNGQMLGQNLAKIAIFGKSWLCLLKLYGIYMFYLKYYIEYTETTITR